MKLGRLTGTRTCRPLNAEVRNLGLHVTNHHRDLRKEMTWLHLYLIEISS